MGELSKEVSFTEFLERHINEVLGKKLMFRGHKNLGNKVVSELFIGLVTNVYISNPPSYATSKVRDKGLVFTVKTHDNKTETIDSCFFVRGLYIAECGHETGSGDVMKFLLTDSVKWVSAKEYNAKLYELTTSAPDKQAISNNASMFESLGKRSNRRWVQVVSVTVDNEVKVEVLMIRSMYVMEVYGAPFIHIGEAINIDGCEVERKYKLSEEYKVVTMIPFNTMYCYGFENSKPKTWISGVSV